MKVLFIHQEITPYLKETPMSLIGRYLPQGIQEKGKEIRIFMPRFGNINERRNQLHEVIRLSGMNMIINDTDHPLIIKVASIQKARIQIYFIDNDDFFTKRKTTIADKDGVLFEDNDDRTVFFSRGVIETVRKLNWPPDVIHCHGWMTSLVPLYIKRAFKDNPLFSESKVVYSLYDDDFEGAFRDSYDKKLKMPGIVGKEIKWLKNPVYANIQKSALDFADGIVIASPNVNPEVEKYARSLNKPILEYQGEENYVDAYNDFYDKIMTL
ncbi:MAG: glycogen/starch synthase [Bacteroidales bacterium]|jgi:starch synthase|nr:glycogen/starch synthase [Bacteroidales bacterium]